jgi:hypothetical protein
MHAPCSEAGFSSQNGDRTWGMYYQKAVLCCEFFALNAKNVHKEIIPVYGVECLSCKELHNRVEKFSQGSSKVTYEAWPGHLVEIATEATVQRVEELIQADRKKCAQSGWPENWKAEKKWTEWVCPWNISYGMQMKEKIFLTGLLLGMNCRCITTKLKSKQASMQWNHPSSPSTKKFKVRSTPRLEGYACHVLEFSGSTVSPFQKSGENVNSSLQCEVLFKVWDVIHRKLPGQLARGVLLHHDNVRPHSAWATQDRIRVLQWELLQSQPYSPDLAPSDFSMFGSLINHLGGKRFADDEEVEMEMQKWLRQQSKDFYAVSFNALVKQWYKCINVGGRYVEK